MEWISKAQHTDNNNWIEGYLIKYPDGDCSIYALDEYASYPVKPETAKVFSGFVDRNDNKVFEADSVLIDFEIGDKCISIECIVKWNIHNSFAFYATNISQVVLGKDHYHNAIVKEPNEMHFTLRKETTLKI